MVFYFGLLSLPSAGYSRYVLHLLKWASVQPALHDACSAMLGAYFPSQAECRPPTFGAGRAAACPLHGFVGIGPVLENPLPGIIDLLDRFEL